jgi:hypothetical protein
MERGPNPGRHSTFAVKIFVDADPERHDEDGHAGQTEKSPGQPHDGAASGVGRAAPIQVSVTASAATLAVAAIIDMAGVLPPDVSIPRSVDVKIRDDPGPSAIASSYENRR